MPKITRILFHLADILSDSLRCGAYGTFCYGISSSVIHACLFISKHNGDFAVHYMYYVHTVCAAGHWMCMTCGCLQMGPAGGSESSKW